MYSGMNDMANGPLSAILLAANSEHSPYIKDAQHIERVR